MGFPGSILLADKEELKQTVDKRLPLGTRGYTRDGRAFRYSKAAAVAIQCGHLCQAPAPQATKDSLLTTAAKMTTNSSAIDIYPSSSLAWSTADYYAEGYMWVNDSSGSSLKAGQLVQIKSHNKSTTTATKVTINLFGESRFSSTLTTKAQLTVQTNPYKEVIVQPAAATDVPIGVTPRRITADYYFWLQTWGPAAVKTYGTVLIGKPVVGDSTAAGGICPESSVGTGTSVASYPHKSTLQSQVGNVMHVGATLNYSLIFLMLAP